MTTEDHAVDEYPGWAWRSCGCCNGMQWGDEPRECDMCGGTGRYVVHVASRTMARWPGGPLLGREAVA